MSLHNAKGLEFPIVFLAGCEEGLFPHSRAIAENDLEEERRLCYVGLTRAQSRLYLSYCRRRRFYGRESGEFNQPSRFLHEIPSELLEPIFSPSTHTGRRLYGSPIFLDQSSLTMPGKKRQYSRQTYNTAESMRKAVTSFRSKKNTSGLVTGAIIVHRSYGKGRILKVEEAGNDLKITVQFPDLGIKKMLQSYAQLKLA